MPRSSRMSARTLSTWAWIETSSAATDSSRISTRGSVASARAIATRWRWPPESALGMRVDLALVEADDVGELADDALAVRGVVVVVDAQHLVDEVGAGLPRVEAGVGVLEDDLHLAAAQLALARRGARAWTGRGRTR